MPEIVQHGIGFLVGLLILAAGGELLVSGARRLALAFGISPLVVGLTVVAFGTSAPEVAVSVVAGLSGEDDIAVGNIVGSNIANILFILGAAVLVRPLKVSLNAVRTDLPVMLLVSALFVLMAVDNQQIDRWEGVVFIAGLVLYTLLTYYIARHESPLVEAEYARAAESRGAVLPSVVFVILGVAALTFGATLIRDAAVGIAELLQIDKRVIALTIVAIGTSLPELATTAVAARRNQPDIAIGNIIGSNIFNILSVAGIAATVRPLAVPEPTLYEDGPVMLGVSLLAVAVCWKGRTVGRRTGISLLALYVAFLAYMVTRALQPAGSG